MRVTELCPGQHLEALDIGDKIGDEKVLTIAKVEIKEVGQEKVRKGVIYFAEFDRGLILNKTNSRTIAALYGAETDRWKGKRVWLYRSETTFQNKSVSCIRVNGSKPD